jgi:SAM-dependent methyltransferase
MRRETQYDINNFRPEVSAARQSPELTARTSEYVFDNRSELAATRYRELSALYDAQTIRHLERRGIGEGWSCLEVGGGGGSIASWMCTRVGATGHVLTTDISPQFLHALPFTNLEVRQHDIRFAGLPDRQFDLAHARLVLMHLPGREVALQRIVRSLRPGGWVVLEEFDALSISPNSDLNSGEQELRILRACYQVLTARGVHMGYGRWLAYQLLGLDLVNVGAEASVSLWGAHSPGTSLFKLNFKELADPILRAGLMTEAEFEADMKRMGERDFIMLSPLMWTAWGQVPVPGSETMDFQYPQLPVDRQEAKCTTRL